MKSVTQLISYSDLPLTTRLPADFETPQSSSLKYSASHSYKLARKGGSTDHEIEQGPTLLKTWLVNFPMFLAIVVVCFSLR